MVRALPTVLLLTLSLVPTIQAEVLAQSWLDTIPAGFHFGMGLGLYDPGTPPGAGPPVYCAALVNTYGGLPVLNYYSGLGGFRYWHPAVSAGAPFPVDFYVPAPTFCAGTVPNNHFGLDSVQFDSGGAFWSRNSLGATEVALLSISSVWVNYCLDPRTESTATFGAVQNALVVVPGLVEMMGSREWIHCSNPLPQGYHGDIANGFGDVAGDAKGHILYPPLPHPNCGEVVTASTGPGFFDLTSPVFLSDANCNSLVNSANGGDDFGVQHCVAVDVLDLVSGPQGVEADEDHFVVMGLGGPGLTGSLLYWPLTLGTPQYMFPQVSNHEPNETVFCSPECSDGIDNEGDGFVDFPADAGCTAPLDLFE